MIRTIISLVFGVVLATGPAAAEGDAAKGEQVFKKCQACHSVGESAKNKVGPPLNGVVGDKWATAEGFNYSPDLVQGREAGKTWDDATLQAYLENPKKVAPKGKMAFAGLKQPQEREDVIAYLQQFDQTGAKK